MADKKDQVSPEKLSGLCVSCGMCCEGTLYSHIPLEPEEVLSAGKRGWKLDKINEDETGFFVSLPRFVGRTLHDLW